MKTPTWRETEEFCRKDGWEAARSTDHLFFRKTLPDGTLLETHRSFAGDKTMSEGRFRAILRDQLKVSADAFWDTLRTGRPAPRPAAPPETVSPILPAWVARILRDDLSLSEGEIAAMSEAEAWRMIAEYWSRPRPPSE